MSRPSIPTLSLVILCLLLAVPCQAGLQQVWGPVLGDLSAESVQVTWMTNVPAQGLLEIEGMRTTPEPEGVKAHQIRLRGLRPDTTYRYRVISRTEEAELASTYHEFTTPSAELQEFAFCAYGDTRSFPDQHRKVVRAMIKSEPRFILHSGDLVGSGSDMADWHSFFPIVSAYGPTTPLYPALGNHEGNSDYYYEFLPLPQGGGKRRGQWYSSVFGSCQIITLDSCRDTAAQAVWLEELLEEPKPEGVLWRVVVFHHPPYSSGPHPAEAPVMENFVPLLETGKVDLVFNGHNHYYERSVVNGLNYVTVGAGGAPIYQPTVDNPHQAAQASVLSFAEVQVSPASLHLRAYDTEGNLLDEVVITP
jgi:hypothetical protein